MLPLIGLGVVLARAFTAALTVYELYSYGSNLYEGQANYRQELERAKAEIKKIIHDLEKEFNGHLLYASEIAYLEKLRKDDPRNDETRQPRQRGHQGFKKQISERIPFRKVISEVCDKANTNSFPQLKKKKGVKVSDLPKARQKILESWAGLILSEIVNEDIGSEFLIACLKQLAASIMFEFVDEILGWKAPIKTEVCFGAKFEDPPLLFPDNPRLKRTGSFDLNPFYPTPYHNQRGSIAADLVIAESRLEPISKTNLFAIVEIKFQGDSIKQAQFDQYQKLLKVCKTEKEKKYGKSNNHSGKGLNGGGLLSLFRYPEDIAVEDGKGKPNEQIGTKKSGRGGR
ncbi:hypothetical protein [Acinetobacter johnsonii]|uniref:hypothetical protein n=1 Tax=Acinetobacter johnsonii TaxID=40214 RepID=UPI001918E9FA|nr:hypothetical protein [Acinetobacter johnsonii]QQT58374.1 hypothetical protein I6I50_01655 [Acinetobacter johnsonii]